MTKPWISREAAEALRAALEDAMWLGLTKRLGSIGGMPTDRRVVLADEMERALDSLPIVDAGEGEAEAALERIREKATTIKAPEHFTERDRKRSEELRSDLAAVRHALRAAKAREAPTPDVIRREVIAEAKDVVRQFATVEQPTEAILTALDAILKEKE